VFLHFAQAGEGLPAGSVSLNILLATGAFREPVSSCVLACCFGILNATLNTERNSVAFRRIGVTNKMYSPKEYSLSVDDLYSFIATYALCHGLQHGKLTSVGLKSATHHLISSRPVTRVW